MLKFRIKLDLSQFYDDERQISYVFVDSSWKEVTELQKHVQGLFDVPEVQFVTDDGIYIPPRESIDVIKSNDVLKAIIPQRPFKRRYKQKSPACLDITTPTDPVQLIEETHSLENIDDNRKCDDVSLTCSTLNTQAKRRPGFKSKGL